MIVIVRALGLKEDKLVGLLAERLLTMQRHDGGWSLYRDEADGNLSSTVEAYFALLYSGHVGAADPRMRRAKQWILHRGGLAKCGPMTKVMLAMNGQYPWCKPLLLPLDMIRHPSRYPIRFYRFSVYARVHLVPVLTAAHFRYALVQPDTPDISDLVLPARGFEAAPGGGTAALDPKSMPDALRDAERFMLERIEPDGTLGSYFSSTFLMIYALLALGYENEHPVIAKAVDGMKRLVSRSEGGPVFVQNFTSTVWDTALIGHALLESGISAANPAILKAGQYLISRQHAECGDWKVNNPLARPGGWGFSDINLKIADVDDTSAALRVISALLGAAPPDYAVSYKRGLNWLLSMQNDNGGWAAFEKGASSRLLSRLPFENAQDALVDPPSADITGRVLEFLGNKAGLQRGVPLVDRAVSWLLRAQEKDGSWYGRWGICYMYGTWAAVTGLRAVGLPADHPAMRKAVRWIRSIQNDDGGFGESCRSDAVRQYVPLGHSTPSQTAWAADALLSAGLGATPETEKALQRLIAFSEHSPNDWKLHYPTGAGLPGGFYIHYHSYRWIWPLVAIANFQKQKRSSK
ncbi:terpene cyclase/mutase family protein [Gordoniibacillus kamchatkensis]|uniref:terpene cyclase/mutase family protein n=1 Tax=Gordoniibacillus kamchatkensis TaxID=1590651 RepID=UPI000ACBFC8F